MCSKTGQHIGRVGTGEGWSDQFSGVPLSEPCSAGRPPLATTHSTRRVRQASNAMSLVAFESWNISPCLGIFAAHSLRCPLKLDAQGLQRINPKIICRERKAPQIMHDLNLRYPIPPEALLFPPFTFVPPRVSFFSSLAQVLDAYDYVGFPADWLTGTTAFGTTMALLSSFLSTGSPLCTPTCVPTSPSATTDTSSSSGLAMSPAPPLSSCIGDDPEGPILVWVFSTSPVSSES